MIKIKPTPGPGRFSSRKNILAPQHRGVRSGGSVPYGGTTQVVNGVKTEVRKGQARSPKYGGIPLVK